MNEYFYESVSQSGGSYTYGKGSRGGISNVYIGTANQKGHGIGSFLGGLFRRILPLLRSGAKAVGREALRTGVNVAGDVLERNMGIRDSIKSRARESGVNLKRKAEEKLETLMTGSGYNGETLLRRGHSVVFGATNKSKRRKVRRSVTSRKKKTRVRNKTKKQPKKRNIKKKPSRSVKRKTPRSVADIFT